MSGLLDGWFVGRVVCWTGGLLDGWFVGWVVYWMGGLLDGWFVGWVVCWIKLEALQALEGVAEATRATALEWTI